MKNIRTVRSPGKIMLAGEWGVLEIGNSCIVAAIDKFVEVRIHASNKIIFNAPDVGLKNISGEWDGKNFKVFCPIIENFWTRFKFCFFATQITLKFLHEQSKIIENFEIAIKSDLSKFDRTSSTFTKLGLGSSAATTATICKAILAFHGYDINSILTQEIVFKLACIAHFFASEKIGSCFDVATAAFEATLVYRRFDPLFLENFAQNDLPLNDIIFTCWPGLFIEKLKPPTKLNLVIGFCGTESSTMTMVKKMDKFKQSDIHTYRYILDKINLVVLELIYAIKQNQTTKIPGLIDKNRQLLQNLSSASGVILETPAAKHMIEQASSYKAASKISGAGGGDCVVAICANSSTARNIKQLWKESFLAKL